MLKPVPVRSKTCLPEQPNNYIRPDLYEDHRLNELVYPLCSNEEKLLTRQMTDKGDQMTGACRVTQRK